MEKIKEELVGFDEKIETNLDQLRNIKRKHEHLQVSYSTLI